MAWMTYIVGPHRQTCSARFPLFCSPFSFLFSSCPVCPLLPSKVPEGHALCRCSCVLQMTSSRINFTIEPCCINPSPTILHIVKYAIQFTQSKNTRWNPNYVFSKWCLPSICSMIAKAVLSKEGLKISKVPTGLKISKVPTEVLRSSKSY